LHSGTGEDRDKEIRDAVYIILFYISKPTTVPTLESTSTVVYVQYRHAKHANRDY